MPRLFHNRSTGTLLLWRDAGVYLQREVVEASFILRVAPIEYSPEITTHKAEWQQQGTAATYTDPKSSSVSSIG